MVILMRVERAGNGRFCLEQCPGEFTIVVIEEARREADAAACGDIRKRGRMVVAVEVIEMVVGNQLLLQPAQGRWRAAADHQRAADEVFGQQRRFIGQRVVFLADQVDAAVEEGMGDKVGDLPDLVCHGEEDILFLAQEGILAMIPVKGRLDEDFRMHLGKGADGLRQEIERRPDGQHDADAVLVFGAEVLALFDCRLQRLLETISHCSTTSNSYLRR